MTYPSRDGLVNDKHVNIYICSCRAEVYELRNLFKNVMLTMSEFKYGWLNSKCLNSSSVSNNEQTICLLSWFCALFASPLALGFFSARDRVVLLVSQRGEYVSTWWWSMPDPDACALDPDLIVHKLGTNSLTSGLRFKYSCKIRNFIGHTRTTVAQNRFDHSLRALQDIISRRLYSHSDCVRPHLFSVSSPPTQWSDVPSVTPCR